MSNSRRLFMELFSEYVERTLLLQTLQLCEEKNRFYASALIWREVHLEKSPNDFDLHEKNNVIYVFAKSERYKQAITHILSPSFGYFLQDVPFNGITIAPFFPDDVASYCIEFPDTVRFSDDEDTIFWKTAVIVLYLATKDDDDEFDQDGPELKIALLIPDYDIDDNLTGIFTLIKYTLDSLKDVDHNIESMIQSYTGNYLSPQVIEYALKAFYYTHSIGADLKKEKGFHYIDTKNINPLRKPKNKSCHSLSHIGTDLEKKVKGNKKPDWNWVRDVDRGMPGFRLDLSL